MNAEQLAIIMLALQNRGCHNVNLVSPTPSFRRSLGAGPGSGKGAAVPLVYNSGGTMFRRLCSFWTAWSISTCRT